MKIINEGHKQRALCPSCDKVTTVTFRYRPYLTESGESIADVLQGFCDGCGERLLIPPQSIPKITPYYAHQNVTQEYKVPSILEDILLNIGSKARLDKPDAFKSVLRFYLYNLPKRRWLKKSEPMDLGPARGRFSIRIDEETDAFLKNLAGKLGMNKNQFIVSMLWDAKDRLLEDTDDAKEFLNETKLFRAPGQKAA